MIRAVLHLTNDQPLLVDLDELPKTGDISVVCRNVRTVDGKRPTFIDDSASMFVFPLSVVRFLEIPTGAAAAGEQPAAGRHEPAAEPDELEIDEDFLRRVREA